MLIFNTFLFITFLILALIHFNWALGGTWGFDAALPTNEAGEKLMTPGKGASATVGFGLLAFGLFYLLQSGWVPQVFPDSLMQIIGWIIPAIFLLRSVGEFRYVGFFKKVRQTEFGRMDTKFYSPLCLLLALGGFTSLWV